MGDIFLYTKVFFLSHAGHIRDYLREMQLDQSETGLVSSALSILLQYFSQEEYCLKNWKDSYL